MKNKFLVWVLILLLAFTSVLAACKEKEPEEPVNPNPPVEHCTNLCPTCGKCLNSACTEHTEKCPGHTPEHCTNLCPTCGKCLNPACTEHTEKCPGHVTDECIYVCPTCGKCQNALCTKEGHEQKCAGHQPQAQACTDMCPQCGKCMNSKCTTAGHEQKCPGHQVAVVCTDICSQCGKCMNSKCTVSGHSSKCQGHDVPHACQDICPTCGKCLNAVCTAAGHEEKCAGHKASSNKHMIVDEDGNYGGTYHLSRYGEGAPLNGELDTENDPYYTVNDYYSLKSTETRTMISGFETYQQTMANSDGIACALMILNNEGEDVYNKYNEINLVDKYERLNLKQVYGNGTTADGLAILFKNLGYTATSTPAIGSDRGAWFKQLFTNHKYVMIRWQAGLTARWMVLVGYETMGTSVLNDDVVIFADPFDASDHHQDGFYIYHYTRFNHWWKDMGSKTGTAKATNECVVIDGKKDFNIVKDTVDPIHNYPEVADLHRLLNKDGTIGGRYGDGRYSQSKSTAGGTTGSTGYDPAIRQTAEHIEYNYYKFPDYCNMPDSDTRLICTGYRAYTQTMKSSCGICSTMSVLDYYGYNWVSICDLITRKDWYGYETDADKKFGPIDPDDNGMKQEAIVMLYMNYDSYFDSRTSASFYNYGGVGSTKLYKVPKALGYKVYDYGGYSDVSKMPFPTYDKFRTYIKGHLAKDEPMVIGWSPTGGHYEVIIGLDDMGTATPYDDVIILGDSSDASDHYKDGFNTLPAVLFYGTWYNGSGSWNQQYVMFGRP